MHLSFPPNAPKLVIPVTVLGPRAHNRFRLTLDTGSGMTVLPAQPLRALGVDLSRPVGHRNLRGVAGMVRTPLVRVPAVSALGRVRTKFVVAAHDFPLGTDTDGLLGLDFLRGFVLKVDFIRGRMLLLAKRWWQFWR